MSDIVHQALHLYHPFTLRSELEKNLIYNELIVIGLQNEDKTVKLACKFCKNGSAAEISEQVKIVLDEFNA